ncbi:MAG: oxidoreductase [Actinobacteria bacterium]|jgi:acrylyl-CoA reductase (NADPH)|nr:oxidoreductase [Actinomycetota bacterium]MBT3687860.1 oxidoreductase [Actinomycetota bacterium]MBT4036583.1 oxidoreductase [Actinomycetota bacterium]MBT4278207.1 oxidoreductase [Actinomycetota bacterium]MBT4343020.1 oxidoreductase [Actinomycetota bacterium]
MFRALMVDKVDGEFSSTFVDLTDDDLPAGDVLVDVEYSTVNFKDGLAVTDAIPIVTSWPMVPGIDLAGTVTESASPLVEVGERIVINGWGLGEGYWGGFSQRARVDAGWTIPVPGGFTTAQAMAIGTAGFTAMLCVLALEDHDVTSASGPVLVTGAAGGVGSIAVALLAALGYEVHASTGRLEETAYLESLGATTVIDRAELSEPSKMPLAGARWAGAVDAVGSHTLANVLAAVSPEGCVAACGLAQGMDLTTTVVPFILRGVTLRGVNSVTVPRPRRLLAWERLATDLDTDLLESMTTTISLDEVPHTAAEILAGRVRGRVVVDLNAT